MHPHRSASRPILAIVGGETLLGKEVRELLEGSDLAVNIELIAAEAEDDDPHHRRGRRTSQWS